MTYRIDMDAKECEIAHYLQVRGIFVNLKENDIDIIVISKNKHFSDQIVSFYRSRLCGACHTTSTHTVHMLL